MFLCVNMHVCEYACVYACVHVCCVTGREGEGAFQGGI